ncbi:hypothetical protein D3870_19915 [Noviherbaspirillum cavernae]|uniref:Apolipophorin n=2 Tax=Noviherbaspirillum cavernae TaxID=2320862 RepID=A0A418WWE5_9BURK|nr:hypothetical protein D3870_19915 [Noviherbaspirillum cavernae]
MRKTATAVLGVAALAAVLTACQKKDEMSGKGPAEKAGEKIDQAAAKASEELSKVGEKTGQALQDAGQKLESKAQEMQKQPEPQK